MAKKAASPAPVATAPRRPTRSRRTSEAENVKILENVKNLKLEQVLSDYAHAGSHVTAAMSVVNSRITEGIKAAEELDTAIELKQARLKELYQIEEEALNIQEIQMKAEEAQKQADRDRQEREQLQRDSDILRQQKLQRESEEQGYRFQQAEARWNADFAARKQETERLERLRTDDLTRDWTEREEALKEQETEVAELRTQVAGFEAQLAAARTEAAQEATESTTRNFEHQLDLMKRENAGAERLRQAEKTAEGQTIASLQNQIAALREELTAANLQVQATTRAALESASGRAALEATQQTVAGGKAGR